ncbi:MAG: glycoside hydrolase family 3 C-terminal domain-containing protein [Polyangiaceae bacterium]|nr:glycoside hydrolase family 3 C-terminal domain-containing protein [Polyangiaceae bacterium]
MQSDHPRFVAPCAEVEQRVESLLGELTLQEKIELIGGRPRRGATFPNARIGLPELRMSDGPMGVHWWCERATAYPAQLCATASWDESLWYELGVSLGRDCRARGVHILLAPGVNLYRSALCGRNFEYMGEDPLLASRMATRWIRGVQSIGVSCTVKHFALNFQEYDRHNVSSDLDERTLHEVYLPAFKAAVTEAGSGAVMTAYNLVNGTHCSEHRGLITDLLKGLWAFDGVVMSDWTSTYDAVRAANAGLDLEMPTALWMNADQLVPAIERGEVSGATLDDKVRRLLRLAVCFGWLDHEQLDPSIPLDDPRSAQMALEVARSGIVLLKNDADVLPLRPGAIKKLAVIGTHAHPAVWSGGGSAHTPPTHQVSVLEGLRDLLGDDAEIVHVRGPDPNPARVAFLTCRYECDSGSGLVAEYFNNAELAGAPTEVRVEPRLNVRWGTGAPMPSLTAEQYTVRWSGWIVPELGGRHGFRVRPHQGAVRISIDGQTVLDTWAQPPLRELGFEHELRAGTRHRLIVEYKRFGTWAGLSLGWWALSDPSREISACVRAASAADAAVVCVGFDDVSEGEGFDRPFAMHPELEELVIEVAKAQPNTVVVLTAGGNVDMRRWLGLVKGLVFAFYPGQEGGRAIAEILLGQVNPSGKLPVTFEKRLEDRSSYHCYHDADADLRVRLDDGVFGGYRHSDAHGIEPQFPFGFGLSYTTFAYEDFSLSASSMATDGSITVSFDVVNTGSVAGAEIAELYVHDVVASVPRPPKELKGFAKVRLEPGERRRVEMALDRRAFEYYDAERHEWVVEPGEFEILVGASCADMRLGGRVRVS